MGWLLLTPSVHTERKCTSGDNPLAHTGGEFRPARVPIPLALPEISKVKILAGIRHHLRYPVSHPNGRRTSYRTGFGEKRV